MTNYHLHFLLNGELSWHYYRIIVNEGDTADIIYTSKIYNVKVSTLDVQ